MTVVDLTPGQLAIAEKTWISDGDAPWLPNKKTTRVCDLPVQAQEAYLTLVAGSPGSKFYDEVWSKA